LDINGGLLGFYEKLTRAADAEAVIRRLGSTTHLDRVFMAST
jgi:hypothetical protein